MNKAPKPGRWTVAILVTLFLAGVIIAFLLVATGWRPSATRNYGELVQPPRPVGTNVTLTDLQGKPADFSALRGKWTLVYFGSAECLKPCTEALYKMRQLVAAQGAEGLRVQRVFVVTDTRALDVLRYTLADYPGTLVYTGPAPAVRELANGFALPAGSPLDGLHRLYMVDPLGNFMMSYPDGADLSRMNKDLTVLLRTSRTG